MTSLIVNECVNINKEIFLFGLKTLENNKLVVGIISY